MNRRRAWGAARSRETVLDGAFAVANVLPLHKRVDVVKHLVEGASVRATSRLTDVSLPTVLSTLLRMGDGCDALHNRLVVDLDIRDIECDELWSFIHTKQARVKDDDPAEYGDAYTFLAMARTQKLMIAYAVGKRDEETTKAFIGDLRARLVTIPQISTDGFQPYPVAVGQSFGGSVDHAVIQKNYKKSARRGSAPRPDERFDKYEQPPVDFITKKIGAGAPDLDRASTSHIERANLTVRMHSRRFTRRCNGFSRKIENHRAAVSLHVAWYNFCRVHEALRITPAMEAGITDHVWSVEELVTKALAAEPCAPPEPKKLVPPAPPEGKPAPAARELPNGRGWLRALPGGKGKPAETPRAPTPPAAPVKAPRPPEVPPAPRGEPPLALVRPKPEQMNLFPDGWA